MRLRWLGRARLPLAVLAVLMGMDRARAQAQADTIVVPPPSLATEQAEGAQAQPASSATQPEEFIVDVVVNGQPLGEPQILRRSGDALWLAPDTLALARIVPPASAAGETWVSLATLPDVHAALDETALRLTLDVATSAFTTTNLTLQPPPQAPDGDDAAAPLAGILGYDFGAGREASGRTWSSLYLDAAVSKGRASCGSRHLLRTDGGATRLDSSCIVDWPERRVSLTAGDAIGRPWSLSGPIRFGGLRIGTDFALQPDLATQPLLGIEGSARVPSVMEVWLDQQLLMQGDLPPGDFRLEGIPPVAGSGDLRAVVTDATGRRTTYAVPFYSDPSLLRPGLADWSLEIGRPRVGYLTPHDAYGDPFAMLTWRQGLTSSWTSELRVEAQQGRRVVGLGSHLKLWRLGVVELAAAQSRNGNDVARSRAVGYSFHGRRWSLGVRDQRRDDRWSDLAYPVPGRAPTREMQVDGGLRFGRTLVTAGGFLRETPSSERQRFARAGLSVPIGRGYLTLSGFRALEGAARGSTVSAMFTLPLSPASSMAAWVDRQGGAMRPGVSLQRSAPAGLGHGYRVVHQDDAFGGRTQFDGSYAADAFRVDGSMTHTRRGTQLRAGLSGALVATRDGFFRAQDRSGSFAVVHLPDANTRIYRDHQVAAVTNARGLAIVPNLRAFQANRLDVETDDLSLSTRIDRPSIALVPGRRQVLRADFAAAAVRPLTLRLRTREGSAIPAGAVATMDGGTDTAPVGHGGLLYLELTRPVDAITVSWAGTHCRVPAEPLRGASDPDATLDVFCE